MPTPSSLPPRKELLVLTLAFVCSVGSTCAPFWFPLLRMPVPSSVPPTKEALALGALGVGGVVGAFRWVRRAYVPAPPAPIAEDGRFGFALRVTVSAAVERQETEADARRARGSG